MKQISEIIKNSDAVIALNKKNKSMNSVEFKDDVFLFRTDYQYEKGLKGDGYLQPDDNDKIDIDRTFMVGYVTENGQKIMLKIPADVTYIINETVMEARDIAIEKQIENYG